MKYDYPPGATPIDPDEAADLLLVHLLGQPRFTWGSENLIHAGDCRKRYINALQAADRQDYGLLLAFIRS